MTRRDAVRVLQGASLLTIGLGAILYFPLPFWEQVVWLFEAIIGLLLFAPAATNLLAARLPPLPPRPRVVPPPPSLWEDDEDEDETEEEGSS